LILSADGGYPSVIRYQGNDD